MSSDLIYMETFHTLAIKMTYYFISGFFKNAKKKWSSNELQASSTTGKLQFYLVLYGYFDEFIADGWTYCNLKLFDIFCKHYLHLQNCDAEDTDCELVVIKHFIIKH